MFKCLRKNNLPKKRGKDYNLHSEIQIRKRKNERSMINIKDYIHMQNKIEHE